MSAICLILAHNMKLSYLFREFILDNILTISVPLPGCCIYSLSKRRKLNLMIIATITILWLLPSNLNFRVVLIVCSLHWSWGYVDDERIEFQDRDICFFLGVRHYRIEWWRTKEKRGEKKYKDIIFHFWIGHHKWESWYCDIRNLWSWTSSPCDRILMIFSRATSLDMTAHLSYT